MPRDPRSIRTPSFRAKLNQIKGLSGEEKALTQRIGNLIDTLTITQRQVANPRGRRRRFSQSVPRPASVTSTGITGGVQVRWSAVDFSELYFYEIDLDESAAFPNPRTFQTVNNVMSFRASPGSGSLFIRIRTVAKDGRVSRYTPTESVAIAGATVFRADQDNIYPENRTTVSPKPTLLGDDVSTVSGSKAFVGAGAVVGPSPLTVDNQHSGYELDVDLRNDVTATLHQASEPFPGLEQRTWPGVLEYIDEDTFYSFDPQFYLRPIQLPSHVADFFATQTLTANPSTLNIEMLRYRLIGEFYSPQSPQTGTVQNASMGTIHF